MKDESDDFDKNEVLLEVLKGKIENLDHEIATLPVDPHTREEVEHKFREWERKFDAESIPADCDPAARALVEALKRARLKALLKEAAEGPTNPPSPAKPDKDTIH